MYLIGLDIGGTKCAVTLGFGESDAKPQILSREEFATSGLTWQEVLKNFSKAIERLRADHAIASIGISCGGPLDSERGIIQSPPNLPGWDNVEIVRYFQEAFHIPARLQNDADACALAEWKYGAGKGTRNMVFLTFGTGLGAGLILNGKLYSGTNGNAGEAGHIRLARTGPTGYGKKGSFEGFCSGQGIAKLGAMLAEREKAKGSLPKITEVCGGADKITAKHLAEFARRGDPFAKKVYRICSEKLGEGLSILVDFLNPEVIVIGGVFMRSHDLFLPYMERVMKRECLKESLRVCRVVPAALGENIGDYAALAIAQSAVG